VSRVPFSGARNRSGEIVAQCRASVLLLKQAAQELIADGCHGVTRYPPTGDKTMRLHAQTGEIILFCAGEPDRSEVRPTLRLEGAVYCELVSETGGFRGFAIRLIFQGVYG
jgi:hypothetical protein